MRQASRLADRARSIFEDLGYSVEVGEDGGVGEFRAQRRWRQVSVTTVPKGELREPPAPGNSDLHCFVTDGDVAPLCRLLEARDPEYEYAVIDAGDGEDDYEVVRAPPACR